VLLGALLPDLVDKPLGFWIAPEFVNNSLRSVGHSILFGGMCALAVGLFTRRRGAAPVSGFALALAAHLAFDRMWQMPAALLWPFHGWSFPEGTVPLSWWLRVHFGKPAASAADLLGTAVLGLMVVRLTARGLRRLWRRSDVVGRPA
jgi:membrane-bound metal-dependent hydrolase YbcI (DUF457 family)